MANQPSSAGSPEPGENLPALQPSPAARDRVVAELTRHFSQDEITQAELEMRLDRAYRATTIIELQSLVTDIEAASAGGTTPAHAADPAQSTNIRATLSAQERKVSGPVPRSIAVRARAGYVELDLRNAIFQPGLTEINVSAFMGYVQIRFPANVRVESEGGAFLGFFATHGASAESSPCIVKLTGRARIGFVEATIG